MGGKILAITSGNDPHIEMVERYLDSRIIILDPSINPLEQQLTYRWDGERFIIILNGSEINDVSWVWYRKPRYPSDIPVPSQFKDVAMKYLETHYKSLFGILQRSRWISDPWHIFRGENKLLQMEVASSLGFNVPDTVVTNNPGEALSFRERIGDLIVKSIAPESLMIEGKVHLFYTTYIRKNEELDLSGLCVSPTIFQQVVAKTHDLRVTVVGNEVFACKIEVKGSLSEEIDWRKGIGSNDLVYSPLDLDEEISMKCVALTSALGILFSAIDLAVDKDGKVWFLEVNPNGQWGFVEENTGLSISKAFVRLFSS